MEQHCNSTQKLTSITWERLAAETRKDANFKTLQEAIHNGFLKAYWTNSSTVPYWPDNLHVAEDVVIYNDRVVISSSLRSTVLDALHSAHQGVSTMGHRARLTLFWPGMTYNIEDADNHAWIV